MVTIASALLSAACSSDEGEDGDALGAGGSTETTGGTSASGGGDGLGTGGFGTGGLPTGGSGTGGFATGGSNTGGEPSTGGISGAGGFGSGGEPSTGGDTGSGGVSTGGSGSGGAASGGATSSGGAGTGGTGSGSSLCPPGIQQTIVVAKDGSGQFTTVKAALDSIPSGSTKHIEIHVKPGTYKEKLVIEKRTNLCLTGDDAKTTILTYDDSSSKVGSTSGSYSVLISADDFSAANITFENTFGTGSQAVAARMTGQRQQFLDCRFVGMQDTLYVHGGLQYFRDCYTQGNTDYIFGGATAVFENCEMRNMAGGSAVTAPNTALSNHGLVFLGGTVTADSSVKANSVALGRPWGADGEAVFLNLVLGAHVAKAGFVVMSTNQPENARFGEYQSTGPGANAAGRPSYQLTANEAAAYTLAKVLGSWTPTYSK